MYYSFKSYMKMMTSARVEGRKMKRRKNSVQSQQNEPKVDLPPYYRMLFSMRISPRPFLIPLSVKHPFEYMF